MNVAKFLEINKLSTVNIEAITFVTTSNDGTSSEIWVGSKKYECYIPYTTLVSMLKQYESSDVENKLDKYLSVATVTQV